MDDIRKKFGRQLKLLRVQKGMTQQQLAERADVSISFLGNIERGTKSPTIDTVQKLSNALNVSMVALLGFDPEIKEDEWKKTQMRKILCECADKIEELYKE